MIYEVGDIIKIDALQEVFSIKLQLSFFIKEKMIVKIKHKIYDRDNVYFVIPLQVKQNLYYYLPIEQQVNVYNIDDEWIITLKNNKNDN